MDDLEEGQLAGGCIVSSSSKIPASNTSGDNPPHAKAKNRYEEIVLGDFLCTGDYSTPENMRPIIFTVTADGIEHADEPYTVSEEAKKSLAAAIAAARGTSTPPKGKVGFGRG